MHFKTWISLIIITFLTLAGCQSSAEPGPGTAAPAPPAQAMASEKEPAGERKLIRSAELRLEVDSYGSARKSVDAVLKQVDGYIANADVTHDDQSTSNAKLELRVPNEKLEVVMRRLSQLGTVLSEHVGTQDVTDEHYDLSARAANAKKLEKRLLELAASGTSNVKDVLEVERELGRVREEIEVLDGKLERLDDQVTLSRLTVELETRDKFAGGPPASLGDQMRRTFSGSISAMLTLGRGLLLLMTALLPWLPLLGVAGYCGLCLLRYSTRRVTP